MHRLLLLILCLVALALPTGAARAQPTPRQAVEDLLAADRAFAAAAAGRDTASALAAMFHDEVVMPLPDATFARGRAAATAALRANPFNLASRAEWQPIRGGVSADGQHGFTFGFMTVHGEDGTVRPSKYLAYWVRTPDGWRVAAYKRAGRAESAFLQAMLPPALPARLVAPVRDPARLAALRDGLRQAEQAFSDEAQRIGLGRAFRRNGSADAMNMGPHPLFLLGAWNIGTGVGGDAPGSPVSWGADEALVASSGDLGVTFGMIRSNGPVPAGRPAAVPFFTIWRRAGPGEPWRYIAE